jgi:hypothetical protein
VGMCRSPCADVPMRVRAEPPSYRLGPCRTTSSSGLIHGPIATTSNRSTDTVQPASPGRLEVRRTSSAASRTPQSSSAAA